MKTEIRTINGFIGHPDYEDKINSDYVRKLERKLESHFRKLTRIDKIKRIIS